jgi:hypothetical protein
LLVEKVIMSPMFYSLTETAERLGKTEDEVKQLAKDGKLREFRDGSNLLFKIDEVNALVAEGLEMDVEVEPAEAEIAMEPEVEAEPEVEVEAEPEVEVEAEPEVEVEAKAEEPSEAPVVEEAEEEPVLELGVEEEPALEPAAEAEASSEFGLEEAEEAPLEELSEDDILAGLGGEEEAVPLDESLGGASDAESEISLAQESGLLSGESDITDMDTALTGEGINILGETDADYDVTDDSMAETVGPAGTSTEASLEEIEGDLNLDSFGSGSGLLDLSLQADDTSLGGILDEIYTSEGEGAEAAEPGSMEDITAEADQALPEPALAAPEAVVGPVQTVAPAFAEAAPDSQSNILGIMLFLPLAAYLYTLIVTVSAQRGVMPSILESVQGLVLYLMIGGFVATGIFVGVSFAAGGGGTKTPKAKKEKRPKEKKAKKEKPKKEKKAKAEKPKKEKKSLFGKKKG